MKKLILTLATTLLTVNAALASLPKSVDLLVVGGGASGVTAGIQAARMGTNTLIIEELPWIGGMLTSAGVSATDGNYNMRGGLWGEFLERVANHYGGYSKLMVGWVSSAMFEPSVGERIFREMVAAEKNLQVENGVSLISIGRDGEGWLATVRDAADNLQTIEARLVIDATELGDVAKMAGVGYDVGMESRLETGEDIAPLKANNIVQDMTWVAVLKDYGKDMSIARPEGYVRDNYICSAINPLCTNPAEPDRMHEINNMITYGKLQNNKYMINWPISGNDYYANVIDLDREQREVEFNKARQITMGFIYFLQQEFGFKNLAPADDEFPSADRLALIPYHRESRRIHGLVRFDLNDMVSLYDRPTSLYRTTIAVGDYAVDHHHARYQGEEELPNLYFHAVPSFGLPLGTLVPKDVKGMIVAEKSISVSNIVNGATRLQPVVLQIGQAAGALASLALSQGREIGDVPVRDVQRVLLEAGGYLLPYLDVEPTSPLFRPLQRIGATGLLRSTSSRVGWINKTWLNAGNPLTAEDMSRLCQFYKTKTKVAPSSVTLSVGVAINTIKSIAKEMSIDATTVDNTVIKVWTKMGYGAVKNSATMLRGQYAALIDELFDPFNSYDVDMIDGSIDVPTIGGPETGINEITVDQAELPVKYYDLQGIEVSNPEPGNIYIVRRGSSVTKESIR